MEYPTVKLQVPSDSLFYLVTQPRSSSGERSLVTTKQQKSYRMYLHTYILHCTIHGVYLRSCLSIMKRYQWDRCLELGDRSIWLLKTPCRSFPVFSVCRNTYPLSRYELGLLLNNSLNEIREKTPRIEIVDSSYYSMISIYIYVISHFKPLEFAN